MSMIGKTPAHYESFLAHVLKILGGAVGGFVAGRRRIKRDMSGNFEHPKRLGGGLAL